MFCCCCVVFVEFLVLRKLQRYFQKMTSTRRNADINLSDNSEVFPPNEVILSVFWKKGKLGASFYICEQAELWILNDIVDLSPEFSNLRTLITQVSASQILTCGGLSEKFIEVLKKIVNNETVEESSSSSQQEVSSNNKLKILPFKRANFFESCKRQIFGLKFAFEPSEHEEDDHIMFVNSLIDMNAESMIQSLGILLKYLEKFLPRHLLQNMATPILALHHISLENIVTIDEITYKTLQVFNPRFHPSAFKKWMPGSSREGLSIFGVFNRCKSVMGSKRMRHIFTHPSKDKIVLNSRLNAIDFCCKPQNEHIVFNWMECIKKVQNLTGILAKIYRTQADVSHWRSLFNTLYNTIQIANACQPYKDKSDLFSQISESVTDEIQEVAHFINKIVDFEESSVKNKFVVKAGIDDNLDLWRQMYGQVPNILLKVAELELENMPDFIEQCSIVYITELGYLLSTPVWKEDQHDLSLYELPNFEAKFIVNKLVHYKTARCKELDTVLGDLIVRITNVESHIMVMLAQFIYRQVNGMIKAVDLIAELDCVTALAGVAKEYNYQRPELTNDRVIMIKNGRHPLQELCVDSFVSNDTTLDVENGVVHVLTGPNASGKSVYLKQVALIAYLAHVGSFVPADKATICLLDHIHSRIQTVESVATQMSSFVLDLKQMSLSLYNSTPNSLIVIDEFGKGTTEIDGLSLLSASLSSFIERGDNCPFIIVSTHFRKLPNLLPTSSLLHLQVLDHIVEKDEVVYLYKLKNGVGSSSLAHLAAKTAGLDEECIKRSLMILRGQGTLSPDKKLQATQFMYKEIAFMKNFFGLLKQDS